MILNKINLSEVILITPKILKDSRGWFVKSFDYSKFGFEIKEENKSFSKKNGTLRGLHFQNKPHSQAKLICCLKGSLLDIAVDLRKNSPTYLKHIAVELSEKNQKQLFIPKGFAHGFVTLENNTIIEYKVDEYYNKKAERTIRYNDPELKIKWKCEDYMGKLYGSDIYVSLTPILSSRDKKAPLLKDCDIKL
jgi:dTDP-4-dehydrorhamnose 3,5-epimerase